MGSLGTPQPILAWEFNRRQFLRHEPILNYNWSALLWLDWGRRSHQVRHDALKGSEATTPMDMVGRLDELDLEDGAPICGLFPRSEEGTPDALIPIRYVSGLAGRHG